MKLFISQGMRGKTDEDILAERNKAIEIVRKMFPEDEIEPPDSFFQNEEEPADVKASGLWWLGKSFELLAKADVAYFAEGWEAYRGCRLEHLACLRYGVECINYDGGYHGKGLE